MDAKGTAGAGLQLTDQQMRLIPYIRAGIVLSGVLMFAVGVYWLYDDYHTLKWMATPAVVRGTEIRRGTKNRKKLQVFYEYEVSGKTYSTSSNALFRNTKGVSPGKLESLLNQYSDGKSIFIYVDPSHHERSRLRKGFHYTTFLFILGGLFWFYFGRTAKFFAPPSRGAESGPRESQITG